MKNWLLVIALAVMLVGCAEPVPENRLDYVGEWRSKEMSLLILTDGSVAYQRLKGGGSTSITGPMQGFDGDDFVVGVLFMTTRFEVSEPPHEVDGEWTIIVDGVRLWRVAEKSVPVELKNTI